jgi:hypothetical protein
MAVLHITEAELARDMQAVLEKVQQGTEVIVERNAQPLAVMRRVQRCCEEAHGSLATLDDSFSNDLEDITNSRREPLNPVDWD